VQWLSLWPAGQSQPVVSTLNDYQRTVFSSANGVPVYGINNAAIVPLGTGGAFNVYVTDATNLFIDVNGYYMPPSSPTGGRNGIGTVAHFQRGTTSGIYSSATGAVDVAAGGVNQMTVTSAGVAIGTTPGYPLGVAGDINFNGGVLFRGTPVLQVTGGAGQWSNPNIAVRYEALLSNVPSSNVATGNNNLQKLNAQNRREAEEVQLAKERLAAREALLSKATEK